MTVYISKHTRYKQYEPQTCIYSTRRSEIPPTTLPPINLPHLPHLPHIPHLNHETPLIRPLFPQEVLSEAFELTATLESSATPVIKAELEQLLHHKVMHGKRAKELTRDQKRAALQYLIFLKQKRCGRIKARGCADGRKQKLSKTKEESSSPTIYIESLFLSCIIDALEQ